MTDIDTSNKFMVGLGGESIIFLRPIPPSMSKEDALNLAAYIVALADTEYYPGPDTYNGTFGKIYDEVLNT